MSMETLSLSQPAEPKPPVMAAPAARESKRERITDKSAATELARRRLNVLQPAQELGSVSKACQQGGLDRASFYEWKHRFQTHGLAGRKDLPPVHKSRPQTTPPEVQGRIAALVPQHPTRGCNFLSNQLALEGIAVSAPTVRSVLNKRGLGGPYERLVALDEQALDHQIALTPALVQLLEQANPVFAERHVESSRPGELLCQDTFYVGTFKGVGKVYLHTVMDTFGSYVSGVPGTSKHGRSGRCRCCTTPYRATRSTNSQSRRCIAPGQTHIRRRHGVSGKSNASGLINCKTRILSTHKDRNLPAARYALACPGDRRQVADLDEPAN